MRPIPVTLLAIGLLAGMPDALAQTPNPIQATPSQSTGQPSYTLRARVPLTILDVVVTDSKGQFVHGLKQSDFTLLEDNKEMIPNSFEEHRTDQYPAPGPALTAAKQTLTLNTFSNAAPRAPSSRPLTVLLFDGLNIQAQYQGMIWKQMSDFLTKIPPGTSIAILNLSSRLMILQGFTTDPELLKAAIDSKKMLPSASPLEDPFQDLINEQDEEGTDTPEKRALLVDREGDRSAMRGEYELSGMRQIARYLSGMPGRKNLIWFGGSFPLQFPSVPDPEAFPPHPGMQIRPESYDLEGELKSATDLLARAHVAVYPIDGRGLEALPPPKDFKGKNRNYMNTFEHLTMEDIAEQTGGKAFYNTNGLTEAVQQALDTGSNFYTLTYTPTNQTLDTRFRAIKVSVSQPGLHLAYRKGYYAIVPTTTLSGAKVPVVTPMQAAMMRGALDATQILFKVTASQSPGTEVVLPVSNKPDARQMKPPYRHYSLAFLVDVNNIAFTPGPDGNYRGDFEFGVSVYNADGDEIVNTASKTVSPILPPAVYQSMRNGGANAHLDVDVPATGDYFLRIAVHDLTSDRIGAIEFPTSSITPDKAPAVASQE